MVRSGTLPPAGDLSPRSKRDPHHRRESNSRPLRGSYPHRTATDRTRTPQWGRLCVPIPEPIFRGMAGAACPAITDRSQGAQSDHQRGRDSPISIQPQKADSAKISFFARRVRALVCGTPRWLVGIRSTFPTVNSREMGGLHAPSNQLFRDPRRSGSGASVDGSDDLADFETPKIPCLPARPR